MTNQNKGDTSNKDIYILLPITYLLIYNINGSTVNGILFLTENFKGLQSNRYKMFAAYFQPSWPSRPQNFCGCNNKNFNNYKTYYWQKLPRPTFY